LTAPLTQWSQGFVVIDPPVLHLFKWKGGGEVGGWGFLRCIERRTRDRLEKTKETDCLSLLRKISLFNIMVFNLYNMKALKNMPINKFGAKRSDYI